ncbi:MAG: hypothetical protein GY701_08095 [Sulfitobacter sp.]|nr:hypothetical protein [Sulfitobacter sp.]
MPRAGDGTYSLPTGYQATDTEIATASQHNEPLEDLRNDANSARPIVAGGTGATDAAGARTNLGLGTAATAATGDFATAAQGTKADAAMPKAGGTFTGDVTHDGTTTFNGPTKVKEAQETVVALTGTTPAVDLETGTVFTLATTSNTTFTFTNPAASGTASAFTLRVTAGGTHTLTWPASVDWAGGTAPDAPASGETDVFTFFTTDGGATWFGFQAGDALA